MDCATQARADLLGALQNYVFSPAFAPLRGWGAIDAGAHHPGEFYPQDAAKGNVRRFVVAGG